MTGSPPAARRSARWSKDTSSKSNERLEIVRFLIRNQAFLSRFDYDDATFLFGTVDERISPI
eukprot:5561689-Prymnesium_polylepis.1